MRLHVHVCSCFRLLDCSSLYVQPHSSFHFQLVRALKYVLRWCSTVCVLLLFWLASTRLTENSCPDPHIYDHILPARARPPVQSPVLPDAQPHAPSHNHMTKSTHTPPRDHTAIRTITKPHLARHDHARHARHMHDTRTRRDTPSWEYFLAAVSLSAEEDTSAQQEG